MNYPDGPRMAISSIQDRAGFFRLMIGELLPNSAILFGLLYVAGVLIVNTDLAAYSFINPELLKTQYVLAGALWAVLLCFSLSALELIMRPLRRFRETLLRARDNAQNRFCRVGILW
jgi:hypothetical protein